VQLRSQAQVKLKALQKVIQVTADDRPEPVAANFTFLSSEARATMSLCEKIAQNVALPFVCRN
jgi:hypothetical protein